jgi:fumarate reductase flavoprotein subunit
VDSAGQRFVNEAIDYPIFYDAMIANGDENFYLIFDANSVPEALQEGVDDEVAFAGETLAELAEAAGIDPDGLEETVDKYNQMAEAGEDTEFGKPAELLTPVKEGPFYALRVKPAILGTFGGPKINVKTEVIGTDGQPIPGLYAAGEVANGQFFKTTYPASGTSIQMCFTLGRVAGREAAAR